MMIMMNCSVLWLTKEIVLPFSQDHALSFSFLQTQTCSKWDVDLLDQVGLVK